MTPSPIRIVPEPDSTAGGGVTGTSAPRSDEDGSFSMRFRIHAESGALEALRDVRRAILREESTLGIAEGEPAFQDAVFSADVIDWSVRHAQRNACLEKIAALEARVSRALLRDARLEPVSR